MPFNANNIFLGGKKYLLWIWTSIRSLLSSHPESNESIEIAVEHVVTPHEFVCAFIANRKRTWHFHFGNFFVANCEFDSLVQLSQRYRIVEIMMIPATTRAASLSSAKERIKSTEFWRNSRSGQPEQGREYFNYNSFPTLCSVKDERKKESSASQSLKTHQQKVDRDSFIIKEKKKSFEFTSNRKLPSLLESKTSFSLKKKEKRKRFSSA